MPFACPNPNCRSVYNVSAKQAGTRFTCQNCGANLVIEANGLRLDTEPPPGGQEPYEAPAPAPPAGRVPLLARLPNLGGLQRLGDVIGADLATWLFGAGAVFVIIFLFFPLIDQAKITRRTAHISSGDKEQERLDQKLELKKKKSDKDKESEKLEAEEKERKKTREKWDDRKLELLADVDDAQFSFRMANYWYSWGMMIGFLLLAIASLSFLTPGQTTSRRVVGSIVICAQMLLIFIAFVIASVATSR